MINPFKKNKPVNQMKQIAWDTSATGALEQALSAAPVPGLLKGKVKKELMKAAEDHARTAGRAVVTAEDLMQGLLAKMPTAMRQKIEGALKEGSEGLERLQKDLKM